MLNKGQGDLLRRPYLPLRHGANLRLRGFRNFYSHVESYVENEKGATGARLTKG
jgi:hypothetical protein